VFWGSCVVFWCSFWVGFWLSESLRGVFTPARNGRRQGSPRFARGTESGRGSAASRGNRARVRFPLQAGGTSRRGFEPIVYSTLGNSLRLAGPIRFSGQNTNNALPTTRLASSKPQ
jgi:hypothetical protein